MANAHVVAECGPRRWDVADRSRASARFSQRDRQNRSLASLYAMVVSAAPTAQVLTMIRSAPDALAAARAALRSRASDAVAPSALTALVVGGDCLQQRFCESFLQTLGLKVDVAANAENGITAAARSAYSLLIVDARSRGFDADLWTQVLEATAARHSAPHPDVYVVVDEDSQHRGLGDCRAIQHPIRAVNLVRAIERLSR